MFIILSTAHLSTTPGKCSPDGKFRECVYSREIVKDIADTLKSYGYNVLVDYMPLEPLDCMKAMSAKTAQSRELSWRVNYINNVCGEYGADNVVCVSVHVNAAPPDDGKWHSARGWSVYTSRGSTRSDLLADCLHRRAKNNLLPDHKHVTRSDFTDGDADFESDFYILRKTKCPAVLTENLFQDNKEDVAYLLSEQGRHAIVRLHVEGIIDFLNLAKNK